MKGACLCGAVRVSAPDNGKIGVCHCGMCRRWGGGPLFAVECEQGVLFEGESNIGVYASSEWAERAFCKQCGTHLYYRFLQSSHGYALPVWLFDDVPSPVLESQIFIDMKPDCYELANRTPTLTEQEIMALYAPPQ